VVAER
jgi:hypothetical protein